MKNIAYLRVSKDSQDVANQKLTILDYAQKNKFKIDRFFEINVSSRRSPQERGLTGLFRGLRPGDRFIVSELSRLGRSVSQIIQIVDQLIKKEVAFIAIKENILINGEKDIQTKVMVTMFGLFAEIERDLISERTKQGLMAARARGKQLGRPPGRGKSRLDGREQEIKELLAKGVSQSAIAKTMGISKSALHHFITTRKIKDK